MNRRTLRILLLLILTVPLASCLTGGSSSGGKSTSGKESEQREAGQSGNAPKADAGQTQYVTAGATVTLDGSGSTDPNDDPLSFLWVQSGEPSIALPDKLNSSTSFVAPVVSKPEVYSFRLKVSDGKNQNTDKVSVVVAPLSDIISPQVTSKSPDAGENGVVAATLVTIVFSEPLLDSTVNGKTLKLRQNGQLVSGAVSYDIPKLTATFTPKSQLAPQSSYTVTLGNGMTDTAGNALAATTWSFTTGSFLNLGSTSQSTISNCMSPADKEMLSRVNNARARSRSCGSITYPATAPLAWHCDLEQAAQAHSSDMAGNDFFSHTGSGGSSAGQRITATGYQIQTWGENIAAGYSTAEAAMTGWLASSGHCANIMKAGFTELGAASASNQSSTYGIYWTQVFADR
jgi:uncharacterized protein YkwD